MQNRLRNQSLMVLLLILIIVSGVFVNYETIAQQQITYTVQRGTVQETLIFSGLWLPRDQQVLSFDVAGTIQTINVQQNDLVTTGTLLASYATDQLEIQLEQAEADLLEAQANGTTNNNSNDIINAQFSLADANLDLQRTLDAQPWTNINAARLSLEAAQEDLEFARRDYNNAIGDPSNSPSTIDNAYENLRSAERSVERAQNSYWGAAQSYNLYQYNIIGAENDLLREEIDYTNTIQSSSTDTSGADSVTEAQTLVNQLTNEINQSTLTAPFDGIVLDVSVNRGNQIEAFQNVITLAIPEPLEVFANLSFDDAQRLGVGMVGVCQAVNLPETAVQCAVRQIPLGDSLQPVRIAATIDDVVIGQLIEVRMPIGISEDVLWLPPAAVRSFQNRTFVVLQTPDGESVVDITIGLRTNDRVEILSGLSEGDIVIAP